MLAADAPAANEIAQWVADLDSSQFDVRERAQAELAAAGGAALEQVAQTAQAGPLESSTRAINVLLHWSESANHRLRVAALEHLAALQHHPKEAALAAQVLAEAREAAALEAIVALGASYAGRPQINNMILPQLQGNLQIMIGTQWTGGLEGLRHLQEISHVAAVSLYSAPLGDEALDYLVNLPQLRRLDLYGTTISKPALADFQKKCPQVMVDIRSSGAFLGVRGGFAGGQAQVFEVVPGSAANKAGIRPQDIITKLDGQEVKDFVGLTSLIAQHQPGDTVTLTVVRPDGTNGVKTLELPVSFDQWGAGGQQAQTVQGETAPPDANPGHFPGRLNLDRR